MIKNLDATLKKFYGQARSKRTKEFWNKLVISNLVSTRFHLNRLSSHFRFHKRSSWDDDVMNISNDVMANDESSLMTPIYSRGDSMMSPSLDNEETCWLGSNRFSQFD